MTFISESLVLDSLSFAIQDYILPIAGMYGSYTILDPDTATAVSPPMGLYKATHPDWIYFNPGIDGDPVYYSHLMSRLARYNPADNFSPSKLTVPAQVLVPNNGGVTFNYKTGEVRKSGSIVTPLELVYSYKKVKVVTSWPEDESQIQLPTIAIDSHAMDGRPFAIGKDAKTLTNTYFLEVWAENDTQRSFLCSVLEQAFRANVPLINFEAGYPLTLTGGEQNLGFDVVAQKLSSLRVERVEIVKLPPMGTSPIEKYRASITLMVSYIL